MTDQSAENFRRIVERSYLSAEDKAGLLARAEAEGVTDALWRRLDDLLVGAIETRERAYSDYREQLDAEIVRYTEEYESEKRLIDQEMRRQLESLTEGDDAARDRLWDSYYQRIAALQRRLLEEVKGSSKTLLQATVTQALAGPYRRP